MGLNPGLTSTLSQLRITGGQVGGASGGGLSSQDSDLTINGCVITGNSAQASGAFSMDGGRLQGSGTSVTSNVATLYAGGGCYLAGNMKGTITNWNVSDNKALKTPGPARGGGILMEGAELSVIRSEISRNQTTTGGGVAVYGSLSTLTLDNATQILNNKANSSEGGGVLGIAGGKVTLNGATPSGNIPDDFKSVPQVC